MPKDLTTNVGFTVGLGPGVAVELLPGEALTFPDEIADRLLKRPHVSEALATDKFLRRPKLEDRLLPDHLAQKVSPPHDPRALEAEARRKNQAALTDYIAAQNAILARRASSGK